MHTSIPEPDDKPQRPRGTEPDARTTAARPVIVVDPHESTGAETAESALTLLHERQARPLITIDAIDSEGHWIGFTAHDRTRTGLQYEFNVSGFVDAHRWIRQLAPKTWITKEHIEVFAILVLQSFTDDGRIAEELVERFRS